MEARSSSIDYFNVTGLSGSALAGTGSVAGNYFGGGQAKSTADLFSKTPFEVGGVPDLPGLEGAGALSPPEAGGEWTFITTPQDISWSMGAEVNPLKIFGTNQVPVVVGSKGMRELSLGNALVEGFSRGVQVEDKVAALEALMNFTLVSGEGGGYVKVPVFQVTANDKVYGSGQGGVDGGYFVIKDIKVKETIRDMAGMATRAYVDISFTQVPPYQVSSGIDQANKAVTGATAKGLGVSSQQAATNVANQGVGLGRAAFGSNAPTPRTDLAFSGNRLF